MYCFVWNFQVALVRRDREASYNRVASARHKKERDGITVAFSRQCLVGATGVPGEEERPPDRGEDSVLISA